MRLHTPHPTGEALELIMSYEEAYDLMNDLHENLCFLDEIRGLRGRVRRNHQLELSGRWPSILRTVVTNRED